MDSPPPGELDVGDPDRAPFGLRLLDVAAQLDRAVGELEIVERAPDVARGHPEQLLGLPVGQGEHAVRGDHDLGHRSGLQCLVAQHVQPVRLGHGPRLPELAGRVAACAERRATPCGTSGASGRRGANSVPWLSSISALPRNSIPVEASAKWNRVEDAGLRLGVEVHQRVAAHEQVDPRDRGVLHEVVAPEDHRPAQVLAEDVPAARLARSTARAARAGRRAPRARCRWPAGRGSSASSSTSVA